MAEPRIAVHGLAKAYGQRRVLAGVSMTLAAGEMVALVGANGGGKTTTLRMLAGLLRPNAGEGQVLGRDVMHPARADRARIGFMTQRLALYPELSVMQNLMFRARVHALPDPRNAVERAIADFGLQPYRGMRIDRLSGGWARRAQFAATMLHAPALILLDEPTSGLDELTRRDLWARLRALAAAGHCLVVSTHDLTEAADCPQLIFYDDGIAHGPLTPAALMARSGCDTLADAVAALART